MTTKERLHLLRRENHKTQKEIAQILNVSHAAYSYYESGLRTASIDVILHLAEYYSVSMDYLYAHTDSPAFVSAKTQDEALLLDFFHLADKRGQNTILHMAEYEYQHQCYRQHKIKQPATQRATTSTTPNPVSDNPFEGCPIQRNALIGARLRKLRLDQDMKQSQVAEQIGIARVAYTYYENDHRQPKPELLIRFADLFHVTIDYLVGRTMYPGPMPTPDSPMILLLKHYRTLDFRSKSLILDCARHEYRLQMGRSDVHKKS